MTADRLTSKDKKSTAQACKWLLGLLLATTVVAPMMAQDWPSFGHDSTNQASNKSKISTRNVQTLKTKWTFTAGGDLTARAAVVKGVAYFPDSAGNIYAINAATGAVVWSHQLSDYGLTAGTWSRTTPAVAAGVLYIGTQYNAAAPSGGTGWLLAINASTGNLVWKMQPDNSNPFPVITASPIVEDGVVYVGMTSNEEGTAADPEYPCCSVIGSFVAVKARNGQKLWQTFTAPNGYSGANVWGSHAVVDKVRGTVFIGTGNNYSVPTAPAFTQCINNGGTRVSCLDPNDHADSIIALDTATGHVKWATRLMTWGQEYTEGVADGSDFWNVGCFEGPGTNCPPSNGPDYDFGSSPNEITYEAASGPVTIIGAGQKSGLYYALDPDTGAVLWQTQVGPGSSLGGIEWGSASDGNLIYVGIVNFYGIPSAAGSAGSIAALDPATGAVVWQKADPNGSMDLGPLAVANGVVYAPSLGGITGVGGSTTVPTMLALNAATGDTLWSFVAGSSVMAGATIAENTVFWGSGISYVVAQIPGFAHNNQFYAFTLNGH